MLLSFTKMSGAGNDFVVIDNRKKILPKSLSRLVRQVCRRKFSVGADGALILENDPAADFRLRYFNADGSEAEMCGNGARCIAKFAYLLGAAGRKMKFITKAGLIKAEIKPKTVKIGMNQPHSLRLDFSLPFKGKVWKASFLNTGVPHTVIFVPDIEKIQVNELGRIIRFHKEFAPQGTNVNFVQKKNVYSLYLRTYERGVEEETLACGTGACASAIIAGLKKIVKPPVEVITSGKIKLRIDYQLVGNVIKDVSLEGPAEATFRGEIEVSGG
ncbi:MAG: diaminopimelate epimerase [Elusimicrobiota bacterium]